MGRSPVSDQMGLTKGPWLPEEDDKLINYIQKHGHSSWSALPKLAGTMFKTINETKVLESELSLCLVNICFSGLNRCGKSCRLRWINYLRPDIKRGKFSPEEEHTILKLHEVLGNKWSMIASHLPGRTDNEIKNFWNTHLKKKLIQMGFDPMTHRPRTDDILSLSELMSLSNVKGLVLDLQQQFPIEDQALLSLQAEIAKLQCFLYFLQPSSTMSSNSINPNDSDILNLLIKENCSINNLDHSLPSLSTLEENHSSQNSSPPWLHEPPSLNQNMLPSHNPSTFGDDLLAQSVDGFGCNQASSSHDQEQAATASKDWPDHLFDSRFPDIFPHQT